MKAALLCEPQKIEIGEIDIPKLRDDEVMVRPKYAGICGSDVSLFMGHRTPPAYPLVPGHEVVGFVAAVGGTRNGITHGLCGEAHLCTRIAIPVQRC